MLIRRTAIWLLTLGALVSLAGPAMAQPAHSGVQYQTPTQSYEHGSAPFAQDNPRGHDFSPFKPVGFEPEFNWFAPAETSGYGRGQKPNIGAFFSYERLYWTISKAQSATVGSETAVGPTINKQIFNSPLPALNSLNTGFLEANGAWGNRWELGYMDTDDYGWLVSVLDHVSQSQYHRFSGVNIQFDDPLQLLDGWRQMGGFVTNFGKMNVEFDEFTYQQSTRLNGVELLRMYRARQLHSGAYFELLYGVRWLQLQDWFEARGTDPVRLSLSPNPMTNSIWQNRVQNNMVGPEIGFRTFRENGRWVGSLEARFLAAANFQSLHQQAELGNELNVLFAAISGDVGSILPRNYNGLVTKTHDFRTTFSPVGEIRVNAAYTVTRSVAIKVGYTGMVAGGVSRASNRVDYSGNNLIDILKDNYNEIFFVNGLSFGVEINR